MLHSFAEQCCTLCRTVLHSLPNSVALFRRTVLNSFAEQCCTLLPNSVALFAEQCSTGQCSTGQCSSTWWWWAPRVVMVLGPATLIPLHGTHPGYSTASPLLHRTYDEGCGTAVRNGALGSMALIPSGPVVPSWSLPGSSYCIFGHLSPVIRASPGSSGTSVG